MNGHLHNRHLSAEAVQALLDGDLSGGERRQAEEHLAACALCAGELEAYRVLFRDLATLPEFTPSPSFAERVLVEVATREPRPVAARLLGWLPGRRTAHPAGERLQDLVAGVLPTREAARVRAHVHACPACAGEARAWRATFARLDALERLVPTDDFADRVMAQVRVPAPAPAPARVREWRRALDALGRLVPQTREAWAAVSGVALTPAVTLGLVLWTVFSHPALTWGSLASFAWWKATELAGAAWQVAAAAALESVGLFDVYSFLSGLPTSPAALAGVFAVLSLGTVAAGWVLYRNLFTQRPMDGRLSHAPLS